MFENGNFERKTISQQLDQCFPTFLDSQHPYLVLNIFGGTPGWFLRYKDQGIVTIGGTPGPGAAAPRLEITELYCMWYF